jgi:glucose-1-phosphate thymidylyltransferase
MKGIILAGGTGTRLWPTTKVVSKQLLPVYDKPMIYYPLSTLMLAGVREFLLISTPKDKLAFQDLLLDGSQFGISITYEIQPEPKGLAQALVIGKNFLAGDSCLMILGDNIFHGVGLGHELNSSLPSNGAHVFTYYVSNPEQYGVLSLNKDGRPISIHEKPRNPESNLAVTGLYFFDENASQIASNVVPSARGELEITSVIEDYLQNGKLTHTQLSRGSVWLDTGKPDSLSDATEYVRIIEKRSGLKVACLEEIALNQNWISKSDLRTHIENSGDGDYYRYIRESLLND